MHVPFKILEHPADIGIEAQGVSMAEAFENAAIGLMSIILDLSLVAHAEEKGIEVHGSDPQQLLFRWLSEVLYLYDGRSFVPAKFSIRKLDQNLLIATVHGETFQPSKHQSRLDVKAITYHQMEVKEGDNGAVVRVFFDI